MSETATRIKFGVAGVVSVLVFAAAMFIGLTDGGPGPIRAFAIGVILAGGIAIKATVGHDLPARFDIALVGCYAVFGLVAIVGEGYVSGDGISRETAVRLGVVFAFVTAILWVMLKLDRRSE